MLRQIRNASSRQPQRCRFTRGSAARPPPNQLLQQSFFSTSRRRRDASCSRAHKTRGSSMFRRQRASYSSSVFSSFLFRRPARPLWWQRTGLDTMPCQISQHYSLRQCNKTGKRANIWRTVATSKEFFTQKIKELIWKKLKNSPEYERISNISIDLQMSSFKFQKKRIKTQENLAPFPTFLAKKSPKLPTCKCRVLASSQS